MPNLSTARQRRLKEVQNSLTAAKKVTEDTQSIDSSKMTKVSRMDQVYFISYYSNKAVFFILSTGCLASHGVR